MERQQSESLNERWNYIKVLFSVAMVMYRGLAHSMIGCAAGCCGNWFRSVNIWEQAEDLQQAAKCIRRGSSCRPLRGGRVQKTDDRLPFSRSPGGDPRHLPTMPRRAGGEIGELTFSRDRYITPAFALSLNA